MKTLALDMDGVLADVYSVFIKIQGEETGDPITMEDVAGVPEREAFPNILSHVNKEGFFRNVPLMKGCKEFVEKLNERYKLYIVSAATEFPLSLSEKQAWLQEHFPFITWRQMVFCGSKEIIKADIMIDDHFKNLDHFPGETYLFTQPHNSLADAGRHRRVDTWKDIAAKLLTDEGSTVQT